MEAVNAIFFRHKLEYILTALTKLYLTVDMPDVQRLTRSAHTYTRRSVRGVDVDGMSHILVSGGADGKVVLWHVKSQKVMRCIPMACGVAKVRVHRESAMVAIALDDFSLCIVDLETKRVVRRFPSTVLINTLT